MITKILFLIIFATLGALGYGWVYNRLAIQNQEAQHLKVFMNAGPRFTAYDGQELCLRVQALEAHSYGFANAGYKPLDCQY